MKCVSMATEGRQWQENSFCQPVIFSLHCLSVGVFLALGGCATTELPPERTPAVEISASTWRQVDDDISMASQAATEAAGYYARTTMETWISRVRQRSEDDFIPWYTSYWTQQWLSVKFSWYKLNDNEGRVSATQRLTAYLEECYRERVLIPVAQEVSNPEATRRLVTGFYVENLGKQLKDIPPRYGVPQQQFDRRLKAIPAITLGSPPARRANLYDILHAEPLVGQPAYAALIDQISQHPDDPAGIGLSPVAERAADRLGNRFAVSGGAGAFGAVVGGALGMVVSVGAAGYSAITHERQRPELEAQLRDGLNAALDETWHSLMDDPEHGVMAGVHRLSTQIEGSLAQTRTPPGRDDGDPPDAPTGDTLTNQ